jgi:hypothetical protein
MMIASGLQDVMTVKSSLLSTSDGLCLRRPSPFKVILIYCGCSQRQQLSQLSII